MKRALPILAAAALAAGLAACGDDETTGSSQTPQAQAPATTATAPAKSDKKSDAATDDAFASNAREANKIVGEGAAALQTRLSALKGHPIVVNQWASWCPPCRAEFPYFEDAVKKYGDRVAFVGIDYLDNRDAAESFLADVPAGFPSIFDPDGDAARAVGAGRSSPTTVFIDADGKTVHTKLGGYADAEQLDADIRRFALR